MQNIINLDKFRIYRPMDQLNDAQLQKIMDKSKCIRIKKGTVLESKSEFRTMVFLLQGVLRIKDEEELSTVHHFDTKANFPIFDRAHHSCRAIAADHCVILRVEKEFFKMVLDQKDDVGGVEVEEILLSEVEGSIFKQIYDKMLNEGFDIPSLPDIIIKIRRYMDDVNVDIKKLAKMIALNIGIAGSLIKTVNNPIYRGLTKISTVQGAITRLGLKNTKDIIIALSLKELFKSDNANIQRQIDKMWEHSTTIASYCYILSEGIKSIDSDRVMIAGLFHQVGVFPLLEILNKDYPTITEKEMTNIIHHLAPTVSEIILLDWGIDSDLAQVARESQDYNRRGNYPVDMGDIVIVAHLYYHYHHDPDTRLPKFYEVPAYKRLDLPEPDEEGHLAILEEAKGEINQVVDMFKRL